MYFKIKKMSLTTNKKKKCLHEVDEKTKQNKCYLVLSDEEKAKGFVRPVRDKYIHVGRQYPEGLKEELAEPYESETTGKIYVAIMSVLDGKGGTYITQEEYDQWKKTGYVGGCGVETKMNELIAETYARDPGFYTSTFCVGCKEHLPVGEFIWKDTTEKVGS